MKDNLKRPIDASEHQPTKQVKWGENQVFLIEALLPTIQDLKREIERGNPKKVAKYLKFINKNEVRKLIVDENTGNATPSLYYFFHFVDLKAKQGQYDSDRLKNTVEQLLELAFTETCSVFFGLGVKMSCIEKNPYYSNLRADFKDVKAIYMKSHGITGYGQDYKVNNMISAKNNQDNNSTSLLVPVNTNAYDLIENLANTMVIEENLEPSNGNSLEVANTSDDSGSAEGNNDHQYNDVENEKKETSNYNTKTDSSGQNDNLSIETESNSDSYKSIKDNNILSQLQEKKPNIVTLELKSKLDTLEVQNEEKQETEKLMAEIGLNLERQQAKVSMPEHFNLVNETIWDNDGLAYIHQLNAIYKPESVENIVSLPSHSIIISDLIPKIDPIAFLGTFSFGQKQAAGIDLPNIGFMEGMFL